MKDQIVYTDIDLAFNIHPVREDLVLSVNEAAIIRSLKNLVLTNHFERLFQSEIGSNVNKMLFDLVSPLTANIVQREIYDVITAFEPRVSNLNVSVTLAPDDLSLIASIKFYIENSTTLSVIDMLLEKIR